LTKSGRVGEDSSVFAGREGEGKDLESRLGGGKRVDMLPKKEFY